jgi:tetratricopeptide (TPR) repeat protein
VARGPGIKRDESLFGASLLDVCPTILAALGLPVGADMDGKPLTNIFSEPPSLRTTPSWDYVDGPDGRHGPESSLDPADAAESLEQLIELGYIERPDADREKAAREAVRELRYNRAQAFIDAGRHAEAEAILTELIEDWPEEPRFSIRQAACMIALGKTAAARNILEDLFERQKENAVEAKKRLKEFNRRHGDTRFSDLSREDQKTLRRLRAESTENPCAVHYLLGIVSAADGDHQTALDFLKRAEETGDPGPELHVRFGKVYGELKRWKEARERFKRALAIDSEDADAHVGLARCDLAERRNRSAVERALTAVGLRFHNPEAHFVLGVGLHRIGRLHEAVRALKVAVTQNPNYVEAHRRLAYIHRRRFGDEAAAEDHIRLARESRRRLRALRYGKRGRGGIFRDPGAGARALTSDLTMPTGFGKTVSPAGDPGEDVVVVSGLPRSGTSMMMQILEAGGYPVLTDGTRAPDEDNPLGYYEYGPVTGLRTDGTWVTSARGKAVKVIAQLLRYLPAREGLRYRVIFMDRPLDAVLRSQEKMLARAGKSGRRFSERLAKTYRIQLGQVAGLLERRGIPVLVVEYDRCIADPAGVVTQVNDFLGGNGNTRKMTGAVRPALRRNQSGTPGSAGIRRNRAR